MDDTSGANFVELAAQIASAYVAHNRLQASELPELIESVYRSLVSAGKGASAEPEPVSKAPAVSIRKSLGQEYLICLEDGKKFKSLKRHLRTTYNLSPEDYRAKWNLPSDYPMVAPEYAAKRSELARASGLGQQRRKQPEPVAVAKKTRKRKTA